MKSGWWRQSHLLNMHVRTLLAVKTFSCITICVAAAWCCCAAGNRQNSFYPGGPGPTGFGSNWVEYTGEQQIQFDRLVQMLTEHCNSNCYAYMGSSQTCVC
jgi:hypothetical protein